MSASSGSGVSGIVQNSALAFVASAQGISPDVPTNPATLQGTTSEVNQTGKIIYVICFNILILHLRMRNIFFENE